MTIPDFSDSRAILLEDKLVFDAIFAANPPEVSTYTFTNLYAWRKPYNSQISMLGGMILICDEIEGRRVFLEPLGDGDARQVMLDVFERLGMAAVFERLHKSVASSFQNDSQFIVEADRDNFDYVYLSSDLIELPGRKYDAKRNFINRFKAEHKYEYVPMTQASGEECHRFAEIWCDQRMCRTIEGMNREQCAVYEMLSNFDALGIVGGAIRMDGEIAAFSLGEALDPETFVVHVEKADAKMDGIYQMINNEFCSHEANGFEYVNREQDLGVEGLRKAKLSYHPVELIEAYRVRIG